MIKGLRIILFSLLSLNLHGQSDNPLLGVWVKKGAIPDNIIEDPFTDIKYVRYDFRENGIVYYSNCFLERGVPSKYRITEDRRLSLNYVFHKIVKFTEGELLISDDQNNLIHLIKITGFDQAKDDSVSTSSIVYKSNFRLHPTLKANIDLYNYFFSVEEYMDQLSASYNVTDAISVMNYNSGNVSEDISVRITFIIDKKGLVKNIRILESTNPKKESRYISKIASTAGYWTPAKLNGAFVDTEITLEFKKMGLKTIEKLTKADILFNKGRINFDNGKYNKSLELVSEALAINPTNQRYLLGRAYVYFELKNNTLGCEDLRKITDYKLEEVNKLITERCSQ